MSSDHPIVPREPEGSDLAPIQEVPGLDRSHGYEEPAGAESGFDFRRYLWALWRYKLVIALVLAVGTAAGFYMVRQIQLDYAASATIWVENTDPRNNSGPLRSGELLSSYAWVDLLKSAAVLEPVVSDLRLHVRPPVGREELFQDFTVSPGVVPGSYRLVVDQAAESFSLTLADGSVVQRARVGTPVGEGLGFRWVPPAGALQSGQTLEFGVTTPRDAARALADQLGASMSGDGNFLRVRLTGKDPVRITTIVNAVSEQFIDKAAELKSAQMREKRAILEEQLQTAQENLAEAELALESFRVRTATLPTDRANTMAPTMEATRDPAISRFFGMRLEAEEIRRDRQAMARALSDDGPARVEALEIVPSANRSSELRGALQDLTNKRAELRGLQQQYTDEFAPVRRLQEDIRNLEENVIPRLTRTVMAELGAQEQQLASMIGAAGSELEQIPPRTMEEARLSRSAAIANNLYTNLRARLEEARLAAVTSIPDVRILDPAAVPTGPVDDERQRILLMAILGSLGLGLAGAILLDRMDPRLRYPDQVTHELGLPILGAVPHVTLRNGGAGEDFATQLVEAFREIRLSLLHACGDRFPLVLTVTSPGAGDGKSFIAANLALAFADLGHETVLIDGDVRRGALHRLFDRTRTPGITDFLAGRATRDEVLQPTTHSRLHVVPSGSRLRQSPELLASSGINDLIRDLRRTHGVIIVDSPPLAAGVDPFLLAKATGNVAVVLRTGATNRELAGSKLELMDRMPVRLVGAILNDVPPRGAYRYYGYLSGYEAVEEIQTRDEQSRELLGA